MAMPVSACRPAAMFRVLEWSSSLNLLLVTRCPVTDPLADMLLIVPKLCRIAREPIILAYCVYRKQVMCHGVFRNALHRLLELWFIWIYPESLRCKASSYLTLLSLYPSIWIDNGKSGLAIRVACVGLSVGYFDTIGVFGKTEQFHGLIWVHLLFGSILKVSDPFWSLRLRCDRKALQRVTLLEPIKAFQGNATLCVLQDTTSHLKHTVKAALSEQGTGRSRPQGRACIGMSILIQSLRCQPERLRIYSAAVVASIRYGHEISQGPFFSGLKLYQRFGCCHLEWCSA